MEEKAKVVQGELEMEQTKLEVVEAKLKVEQVWLKVEEEMAKVEVEKTEIEKMAKEQQGQVECPVCLTVPIGGQMLACPRGHLVCSPCRVKMTAEGQFVGSQWGTTRACWPWW